MGIKKLILFLGITISIFSILGGTTGIQNVSGDGNVDQSFEGPFTSSLNPDNSFQPVSQGFVPDQSKLVAVDIFLHDLSAGTGVFVVTIWEGAVGMGSPLGSQTEEITQDGVGPLTDPDILHVDFDQVITLNPGTSYVIQLNRGQTFVNSQWAEGLNGYPDGIGIFAGVPRPANDFGFRTYFEIEVIGGELLPIDKTALLLAGAQMNASWMIPVIVSAIGIGIVIARKF